MQIQTFHSIHTKLEEVILLDSQEIKKNNCYAHTWKNLKIQWLSWYGYTVEPRYNKTQFNELFDK